MTMGDRFDRQYDGTVSDPWIPKRAPQEVSLPGYRDFVQVADSSGSRVYRARQEALDRPVAVKMLLLDDPEATARFRREIEITVRLGRQHPHIVKVIGTGFTPDGRPCIVMEFYDHGSLRDRLRASGPLPVSEVVEAGAIVADALSFAHGQGVLHRDIKPQNILVLPTSYVVADFGIARHIDASQRTSSVDWFTFQHASPQILDGERPSVADDIWSLGSTLFMLLDGEPPFASDNPAENTALAYMKRVRAGQARRLRRADVPAGLTQVIQRCMRPVPGDRFPDAASLRDALRAVAAEQRSWAPTSAPTPSPGSDSLSIVEPTSGTSWQQSREMSPAELADLVSAAASAGRPTAEETGYTAPPRPPRPARSGRLRVVVGAAIAVALAGALGVAAVALARSARVTQAGAPPPGTPATTVAPPSLAGQPTQAPSSPRPGASNRFDPALAPRITTVEALGGKTFNLRWSDPTQGRAQFAVVRVIVQEGDDRGSAILEVGSGVTEAKVTLPGADPGAPYCFLIVAVIDINNTVPSPTQCASA